LRLANSIGNLFCVGFIDRFIFRPSLRSLHWHRLANGVGNRFLVYFGNDPVYRVGVLPSFPLRLAYGIGNALCMGFIDRLVFRPCPNPVLVCWYVGGIGNLFCSGFIDRLADIANNGSDLGFPNRLVGSVVDVSCSGFGDVFTIGNFVSGWDFFIDRPIARNLLVLIDNFPGDPGHFVAMLDVIAALGGRIAGTDTAEARLGR